MTRLFYKFIFFLFKIKKSKNKIKTGILAKVSQEDFTCRKYQVIILDRIRNLIVSHFIQNWRDNENSRSNYMIIGQIYIKIKLKDIIRFLIGQLDLIMSEIKV